MPVVHGLYRYPVKSMRGEVLDEAVVGPAGVLGDRAYALIDQVDGKIASAKNPRKWAGLLGFAARFVDEPTVAGPPPPVVITGPDGAVRSDDPDVDTWLSKALGRDVRLAVATPHTTGLEFEEVWPDIAGLAPEEFVDQTAIGREEDGDVVSAIPAGLFAPPGTFFDLSVVHLLTTATLARLAELDPEATFDVRRYRPNVLLEAEAEAAGEGFVENDWVGRKVVLGDDGATLGVQLPTMRCVMTTLAQEELPRDRRTLRTIAAHNRVEIAGFGTWACAGVYCEVQAGGRVRVGDHVRVQAD
ncbi:MAG TPA: MOSC N-terminal beta barrel domain-containing protein [Acidimicrobiales bacterium]|nr:MOSC N-terminal beta barrel domain-containing protein [Acidimicrobiales bacterium]